MKKIIKLSFFLFLIISCGAQDADGEGAIDGVTDDEHRIFVSSVGYSGDMGGTSAGDKNCNDLASAAGLTRTYKAILSTTTTNANSSLNIVGAVYIFSTSGEKTLVAASSADFWGTDSKSLLNSVSVDEKLASVAGENVWTGTGVEGAVTTDHCSNWTSTGATGFYGTTNSVDDSWLESNTASCSNSYRIYCISQ